MAVSGAKTDLRSLSLPELRELVAREGLPDFRYRQISKWVYDKAVTSLDEMTDLSKELRTRLSETYSIDPLKVLSRQTSQVDGASKLLFALPKGGSVEAVLMPAGRRMTLCISSQVGCTLDCVFCQTARMGFERNLEAREIVGQVLPMWREMRQEMRDDRLRTNIVFMGMGEPLHNVGAVVEACRRMMDPHGLDLGPRRITVSTAGVVPGIRKLAESGLGVRLALSLNATHQRQREMLMPKAAKSNLKELLETTAGYAKRFNQRVTLEYVLMTGVNDAPEDADRLAKIARGGPFKINVIPYNPGASPELTRPNHDQVDAFVKRLWPQAPVVTVRWSMGPDIAAACGQLRVEHAQAAVPEQQ